MAACRHVKDEWNSTVQRFGNPATITLCAHSSDITCKTGIHRARRDPKSWFFVSHVIVMGTMQG